MSQWGEKIPEENFTQKSRSTLTTDNYGKVLTFDKVVNFQENSKRFVVEILTKNLALNFSGVLFFVGIGFSLKWWYKDSIFNILLKQNLPALSESQREMSWETSEYVLKEQNQKLSRNDNESISYVDESPVPHKLDHIDFYINHVSIKFKPPWQKHAYQRFSGIFSENIQRKVKKGNTSTNKNRNFIRKGIQKNCCSSNKYTVWEQPKTWFKLSARGFYFLNEKPQFSQLNVNSFQSKASLRNQNSFSYFGKSNVCSLPFLGFLNTKKHGPTITRLDSLVLDTQLPKLKTLFNNRDGLVHSKDILASKNEYLSTLKNCDTTEPVFEVGDENHLSTSIRNLSYPLQLTKKLFGWHPPVDALIFSSYLDEIPYKLESVFLSRSFDQTNKSNANFVGIASKQSVSGNKLNFPKEKLTNQKRIGSQANIPNEELLELFTTKEFKNETFLKKSQLFEIKQLLKKELQFLIHTISLDFVSENFPIEQNKFKGLTGTYVEKPQNVVNNNTIQTFVNVDLKESKLETNANTPSTFETSKLESFDFETNNGIPSAVEIQPIAPALPPFIQTKNMMEQVLEEGKEKVVIVSIISDKNLMRAGLSDRRDEKVNTTFDATAEIPKENKHIRNAENELIEKGKVLANYEKNKQNDSFDLLNLLNTFTFNNLSSLKNPPILLPTNNNASFWMWKLFMPTPRPSGITKRTTKAPFRKGINQNSTLVFRTIGTNVWEVFQQPSCDQHVLSGLKKKIPPKNRNHLSNINSDTNNKIILKQKRVTVNNINDINPIDTKVDLADSKSRLMSGFVYPDTESVLLKTNLCQWLSKNIFLLRTNMANRGNFGLIPSLFYPKSSIPFREVDRILDKACLTNLRIPRIPITPPTFLLRYFQEHVSKLENEPQDWFPNPVQNSSPLHPIPPKIVRGGIPSFYSPSQHTLPRKTTKGLCMQNVCIDDAEMAYQAEYAPIVSFENKTNTVLEKRGVPLIGGVLHSVITSPKKETSIKNKELFSKLKNVKSISIRPSLPFSNTYSPLPYQKFNHHLTYFPGFPKPGEFFLTLSQISQGNDSVAAITPKDSVINKTLGKGNTENGPTKRLEVDHLFSDCSTRKTAYNGIGVQRNRLTKDFQPRSLEQSSQSSIWGTRFLGPENPLNNRQCHFFGQKQISPLDTNSFQRDYLRQLVKEIVTQSNLKGFTEKLSSVERVKILSFSKKVNSFFFKKRKYTYLLTNRDQWHLLFQEQLRTALEDKRKYPPLTPEEKKETNFERIKVSAPLIMVRFPKEKKQTFGYSIEVDQGDKLTRKNDQLELLERSKLQQNMFWRPSSYFEEKLQYSPFEHESQKRPVNQLYHPALKTNVYQGPLALFNFQSSYPVSQAPITTFHTSDSVWKEGIQSLPSVPSKMAYATQQISENATQFSDSQNIRLAGTKKLLPSLNVVNNFQWLIQEPLTSNSWAVVCQWFFLISVLCWVEQMLLENVFPSLFALEQILLGGKAGERNRVIRVSRGTTPKFQDLAGIDGLLGELSQLVLFLRGQRSIGERFLNKKNSYGVLLTGPPGTGKTFLVRALANEAGVPVLILSAGTLVANKFNSNKPSWSIRHAFRRAKQLTPCILFIDEIDALGKSRGNIVTDINEIVANTSSPTFNGNTFGGTGNMNQSINSIKSSTSQAPEIDHSSWPTVPKGLINKWSYPLKSTFLQESNKISHYSLCDEFIISLVGSNGTNNNEIPHLSPNIASQNQAGGGVATRNTSEENIQGYNQEQSHNSSEAWNSVGSTKNPVTTGENSKRKFGPLTQLLVSMDGVSNLSGILIMGATNRPELLDPALTRPGRFERTIRIEKPSEQKRIEILQLYSHNLGVQDQIPWSYFANRTRGLTAADLAVAMNYSSLKAIVQGSTHTVETIEYGLDCITRFSTTSFCRLSTRSNAWNSTRKKETT